MDLNGARALVTGAGRGIGRAIALSLAEAGCDVALAARTRPELENVAAMVELAGRKALVIPTDMTQATEVRTLADTLEDQWGGVDILVNNAGGGVWAPVLKMSDDDFVGTLNLNLISVFRLTRLVLPGMLQRKRGHIIMIISTSARRGGAGSSAYSAAKFGLNGFAQSLFYETRKSGVRVTSVFPSSVNTELIRGGTTEEQLARWIQPEDIALSVLAALKTDDRATVKEIEVWGTNP